MNKEIICQDLLMGEQQVKSFAMAIFRDINSYLEEHTKEFIEWLFKDTINRIGKVILTVDEGITYHCNYTYQLCKYGGIE